MRASLCHHCGQAIAFLGLVLMLAVGAKAEAPAKSSASLPSTLPPAAPAVSANEAPQKLTLIPRDKGLPVIVRVGMYFVDIDSISENDSAFTATIDLRLRWVDLRLRYAPLEAPSGFKEFRGAEAEAKLSEIWVPGVELANVIDAPSYQAQGLRIFPDGKVELIQRTKAQFSMSFEVERFPFDRQKLKVEVFSRKENAERVRLEFRQEDLDFSRVSEEVELTGWVLGLVDIQPAPQVGWYGESYSRLWVSLEVVRQPGTAVAPVFIPLFASLLIPLLAIWLNRVKDGEFQIEAFELANIIIGGLFAVIALNFTVNAEYQILASGENMVTRLFGLNYLTLGISLLTNIVLFRFNVAQRMFGKYVQEQLYLYLVWAVPILALISALCIVLVAMV